jgi:hypothetical protein
VIISFPEFTNFFDEETIINHPGARKVEYSRGHTFDGIFSLLRNVLIAPEGSDS